MCLDECRRAGRANRRERCCIAKCGGMGDTEVVVSSQGRNRTTRVDPANRPTKLDKSSGTHRAQKAASAQADDVRAAKQRIVMARQTRQAPSGPNRSIWGSLDFIRGGVSGGPPGFEFLAGAVDAVKR